MGYMSHVVDMTSPPRWAHHSLRLALHGRISDLANVSDSIDRLESARDHLPCPRTMGFVGEAVFEELGVRQDDAELVVQLMEEAGEIR